jgi:alanine racemase
MAEKLRLRQYLLVCYADKFLEVGEMGLVCQKIKAKKILSVWMDMLMVDVTEIDCTEGDSVCFLANPTVSQMAKKVKHNTL